MDTSGIDMNNPTNLSYYSQILLYQSNTSRHEILFDGPDNLQRRTLHAFADGFGLEYEYSRATKQVRITRPEDLDAAAPKWRDESMLTAPTGLNEAVDSGVSNGWQSSDFDASSFTDPAILYLWLDGDNTFSPAPHLDITENFTPQSIMSTGPIASVSKSPLDTGLTSLNSTSHPGETARASPSPVSQGVNATASDTQDLEYNDPPRGRSRQATMSPTQPTPKTSTGHPDAGFGDAFSPSASIPTTIPVPPQMSNAPSSVALSAPTPRKTLTDDDRRRMCLYHKENPNKKQTEIGAMFGVERSIVSKVLRQRNKYLPPEDQTPSANYPRTPKRISSFKHGRESPGVSEFQNPSSPCSETTLPPISDQVGILNSLPSSPIGRPYSSSPSSPSRRISSPSGLSPVRSGPLDYHVQTKMRAVKAGGGACWRCRILKKSCDTDTPCVTCPSSDTRSNWGLVGCKRGGLQSQMSSLDMCPYKSNVFNLSLCLSEPPSVEFDPVNANRIWSEISDEQNTYMKSGKMDPDCSIAIFLADLEPSEPVVRGLRVIDTVDEAPVELGPSTREYLDKCILAIMWSILEYSSAKTLLGDSLRDIVVLTRSAARYYVGGNHISTDGIRNDQLIYNSIACLRVALEAMQVGIVGVSRHTHHSCARGTECKVKCISKITSWVDIYAAELSRVLFLKENMTQKSQWLSTFYSLCIQSCVRKVLLHLSHLETGIGFEYRLRFEQYLHLGIRLFTAASGNYDPLMEDYSSISQLDTDQAADSNHYHTAQLAVQQFNWQKDGISSSYDYLKRIFEDFGAALDGNPNFLPESTASFVGWSSTWTSEEFHSFPLPGPMEVDNTTNAQIGGVQCNYPGCIAQPFQTQYLLNSHAAVHSSDRPHYCPVAGCPRSEGGKGFKRKNEMIRHGLVHDYPGYICPFCPDREHKYPRPDNLQRHVRVHHSDKDKDDPELRKVLSQRPDAPGRARRRRMGRVSQESSNIPPEGEKDQGLKSSDNVQGMVSMTQSTIGPSTHDSMLGSDSFGPATSMEIDATASFDGMATDISVDGLYNPSFHITTAPLGQTATTNTSLLPQNDQHLGPSKNT